MLGMADQSVDCIICDPPYNERTHGGAITGIRNGANENGIDFAPMADIPGFVNESLRISRRWCLSFCTLEDLRDYRDAAWAKKSWVRAGIWDRINPPPQFTGDRPSQAADGVAIFHRPVRKHWNGGGKQGIWRHSVEFGKKKHPTQKPLSLMLELVEQFSDVGETVFDPFMGGGSTGVACMMLGRNFIGCEIDPAYFAVSQNRIIEAQSQGVLFHTQGELSAVQTVMADL